MDDPRVLRIITIGLVLAALAVGYFILTGGLSVKSKKVQTETPRIEQSIKVNKVVESPSPSVVAGVTVQPSPAATQSAYSRIVSRTQVNVQTLPKTGFPIGLTIVFSTSAIISGWSLRRFPK